MEKKLYNTKTGELFTYPRYDDQPIVGRDPDLLPVEIIKAPRPDYDPATQTLEKTETPDVVAGTYTYGYTVRDLTAQEILDRLPPHFETSTGIKLATQEQDQTAFTRMLTLIDLTQMDPSEMVLIKDAAGEKHAMSVADFKTMMAEYGAHCYTLHFGA